MNAAEARKLSNDNVPKLVEKFYEKAVTEIDVKIKKAADIGDFHASLIIDAPKKILENVIPRIEAHYQNEGYEVKVKDMWKEKMFMVSWQK